MSAPGSAPSRRQKRMGPAPFASFEDLSDEVRSRLESPEDRNAAGSVVRLPGIREDVTPTPGNTPAPTSDRPTPEFVYTTGISLVGAVCISPRSTAMSSISPPSSTRMSLQTPSTPRIDISRASSSSHHDSRDSTPERELFEGHDPASAKLGLGFREEGALDLRSSTEELDYQDAASQQQEKKKGKARPPSPCLHDESSLHHQRKDSQTSEIGLLSISGRTSRLSSIGSQGSGQSRLSNASHLSVISGQSGLSRSPSPHKMLLETSFCGTKPPESNQTAAGQPGTKVESEVLEKVLLSRKIDPTEAVLAEGISVTEPMKHPIKKAPPEKPVRKIEKTEKPVQSIKSDITIKVDEPTSNISNKEKIPRKILSKSGVEYIYIPLKGPLPVDESQPASSDPVKTQHKVREVKSATIQSKTAKIPPVKPKPKSATPSPVVHKKEDEPKYIRIKLKPDYMYSQEDSNAPPDVQKPDSLDLIETSVQIEEAPVKPLQKPQEHTKILTITPSASPKLPKHDFLKETVTESKTPSPSLSRKSSFASIFRSKEAIISPESPTVPGCRRKNTITGILREAGERVRERSRSRSKSRDRDKSSLSAAPSSTESIDSKTKQKSVFSIFKPKKGDKVIKSDHDSSSSEVLPSIEGIAKVEFKFNDNSSRNILKYYETPLDGDSIRIPLHSPDHYDDDRNILQDLKTSSQDSQDTVIEAVTSKSVEAVVEAIPKNIEIIQKPDLSKRQSSTSSENVVFSTKLGSNNEIFSTKLPKDKQKSKNDVPEANGEACIIDIRSEIIETRQVKESGEATILETKSEVIEVRQLKEKRESKEVKEQEEVKIPRNISSLSVKESMSANNKTAICVKDVKETSNRNSLVSSATEDNDRYSSESERDSEIEFPKIKKDLDLKLDLEFVEPERKGLVLQQDSYDDELPYIPTTLPLERSAAVPIVPIKQRSTFEMKTCPIERPRSTTPINPSCLEEYCEEVMGAFNSEDITKTIEKLRISLPRHESVEKPIRSPRKPVGNTWFEFAEKGISTGRKSSLTTETDTPPPLPPKGIQKEWINFEEIPERRKPPKRIQTLPSRGHIDVPDSVLQDNVVYNYVNPEECKCECHEITAREREQRDREKREKSAVQEDEMPLLDDDEEKAGPDAVDRLRLDVVSDRRSVVSDSSVDLSTSVEQPEANGVEPSLRTPFNSDLGVSSNRSSIVSQEDTQSPDSGSPNAFPKTL